MGIYPTAIARKNNMNKNQFNLLQVDAVNYLLDRVFEHVQQQVYEQFMAIGKINAQLLQISQCRFMHKGMIYPPVHLDMLPYGTHFPALHFSLLHDFEAINKMLSQDIYQEIRNFFSAVISQSAHELVLTKLLPDVLVEELKKSFAPSEFKILDSGTWDGLERYSLYTTQQNIQDMQHHYRQTIITIKHLLMNQMLFQN